MGEMPCMCSMERIKRQFIENHLKSHAFFKKEDSSLGLSCCVDVKYPGLFQHFENKHGADLRECYIGYNFKGANSLDSYQNELNILPQELVHAVAFLQATSKDDVTLTGDLTSIPELTADTKHALDEVDSMMAKLNSLLGK